MTKDDIKRRIETIVQTFEGDFDAPIERLKRGEAFGETGRCYARDVPSSEAAPTIAVSLAPDPVIEVYKQGIDRTLIRENLKRSTEERFLQLMKLQQFAEELQAAGRRLRER